MASILKTGCNQYTIKNGGTGLTYTITATNINNVITETWQIIDNQDYVLSFTIDGIYTFTTSNNSLFFNVTIPINSGGIGGPTVSYIQSNVYVAPAYTGATITINVPTYLPNFIYTILPTDTSAIILAQSIANAINAVAISGVSAVASSGLLTITGGSDITLTPTEVITEVYAPLLWSVCNLFKCICRLTNCILCAPKRKCEEHTERMRKERDELNRIMILYGQFNFMDDNERWDYLGLNSNTDIFNDIFDKLNPITRRCGCCCDKHDRDRHWPEQDRFAWEGSHDRELEDNLPISVDRDYRKPNGECSDCGGEHKHHHCKEECTETLTLTQNGQVINPITD